MREIIVRYKDGNDHMAVRGGEYVQDLVRCKDCKHNPWKIKPDYTCLWDDDFADRPQTPDDFCSYGERDE